MFDLLTSELSSYLLSSSSSTILDDGDEEQALRDREEELDHVVLLMETLATMLRDADTMSQAGKVRCSANGTLRNKDRHNKRQIRRHGGFTGNTWLTRGTYAVKYKLKFTRSNIGNFKEKIGSLSGWLQKIMLR